jgi:hypothetical protein
MDSVRKRLHATSWLALAFVLGQLACRPAPSASAPPTDATASRSAVETRQSQAAAPAPAPYDLGRDEARGGHTLARHVGRTDAELQERLRREPNISAASTYRDRIAAERVVARALAENHARVDQWLARTGSRPNLALDYRGSTREEPIGRSLTRRSPQPVACSDAVVVLRWDGQRGCFVLRSYPEARR